MAAAYMKNTENLSKKSRGAAVFVRRGVGGLGRLEARAMLTAHPPGVIPQLTSWSY